MKNMCYLDKVFVDQDDNLRLYQLTMSDPTFQSVSELITDKDGLSEFLTDDNYITDFSLNGSYLQCDPKDTLMITPVVLESKDKHISKNVNVANSFYDFCSVALQKEYVVIDDSLLGCEVYKGVSFSSFKNIHFAQSTMSAYFLLNTTEGLKSKQVIRLEDGLLKFIPFHFGVPAGNFVYRGATFVQDMTINNREYSIYKVPTLSLYPLEVCTSASLINKACTTSEIYKAVVNTIKDFIVMLNNTLGNSMAAANWAGGNNTYESQYGITLTNSIKGLSKKQRGNLINQVFSLYLGKYDTYQAAAQVVENSPYYSMCEKAALKVLLNISYCGSNPAECLSLAKELQQQFSLLQMYADMFLYKIRVGCYVQHIALVDRMKPYLVGSEYDTVTSVNAGYYYGENDTTLNGLEEF